jgi:CubicO group peptidase (beta-lactamase class C family)
VRAKHQYQGVGHALAGKIMENISGESVPRLYRKHLLEPLNCTRTKLELTSYGSVSTSMELARIGQMMLNGGSYGNLRFTSPQIIQQMVPQPGNDRFEPDKSIRWGVGTKIFDSDGFSDQAYGGSGATGPSSRSIPRTTW